MRLGHRVLSLASFAPLAFFAFIPNANAADEPTAPAPAAPQPPTPQTPGSAAASSATPKAEEAPLSTVGTGLAPAPTPPEAPKAPPIPAERREEPRKASDGPPKFEFMALLQPQFVDTLANSAASPNVDPATGALPPGISANDVVARSDGSTTNAMGFRMRRTRLTLKLNPVPEASAKFDVELFPFLTPGTLWRDAFITGRAKWSSEVTSEFNVGSFKVPFNMEELESSRTRPFIERSIGTRVFFPGDRDTGIWMQTRALKKRLQINLAVVNGVTQIEKAYSLMPDLNRAKDFTVHLNYDFGPLDVGASFYGGAGQIVDAVQLRTKTYLRWAAHGEATLHHTFVKELGPTKLFLEGTVARNMDRGTIYASGAPTIPANFNDNVANQKTGLAYFARLEQRLGRQFIAGFRYDSYWSDLSQSNSSYHGLTPMFGVYFIEQLRWSAEYSYIVDNVRAAGAKAPGRELQVITTYLTANFEL